MKNILFFLFILFSSGCNFLQSSTSLTNVINGPTVQIAWAASSGSPTGYYIEQSTDNINFKQVQVASGGSTQASISGLSTGTTYYFRVRAYNAKGTSGYTAVSPITISK